MCNLHVQGCTHAPDTTRHALATTKCAPDTTDITKHHQTLPDTTRHYQTPPDITRHHQTLPDTTRSESDTTRHYQTPPEVYQTPPDLAQTQPDMHQSHQTPPEMHQIFRYYQTCIRYRCRFLHLLLNEYHWLLGLPGLLKMVQVSVEALISVSGKVYYSSKTKKIFLTRQVSSGIFLSITYSFILDV